MAIVMFFMLACCVPYMMKPMKDAKQYCGSCRTLLVTTCVDKSVKVHVHV
jgi:LITAF-like zinc ribbon domain